MTARHLRLISLTVGDLDRAVAFYTRALTFEVLTEEWREGEAFARLMGIAGARARACTLRLGAERVELLAFETPGAAYPADSRSPDLWFQHFAIVVPDMAAAYGHLTQAGGLAAISDGGPQTLPVGVSAFKFRDPDGHPLELLAFPPGQGPEKWRQRTGLFVGIDHSAIAVSDTGASEAFYVGTLGLHVGSRSLNRGVEQERLDGTFNAVVEVTGLEIGDASGPHVELLCNRVPSTGRPIARTMGCDDVAATRLVIEVVDVALLADELTEKRMRLVSPGVVDGALTVRDPDGHVLCFQQAV